MLPILVIKNPLKRIMMQLNCVRNPTKRISKVRFKREINVWSTGQILLWSMWIIFPVVHTKRCDMQRKKENGFWTWQRLWMDCNIGNVKIHFYVVKKVNFHCFRVNNGWIFTIVSEQKVKFHFLEIENLRICDNFWIGNLGVDYDHNFVGDIYRMFVLIYRIEA